MRAIRILQDKLGDSLSFMHAKQCAALWRGVLGLMRGQRLWLTALGRALPGACAAKHRIKAVDRLVGGAAIQAAIPAIYRALARRLLRGIDRPVVLVDWTGLAGFFVLSAKLAFRGRAVSIFSRTYPATRKATPCAEREFLNELKTILPARCRPVLVTDAGYMFRWYDSVRACGWDYVGRVRGRMTMNIPKHGRLALPQVHELATKRPRDLGMAVAGKRNSREHRVVVSSKPKTKGRKRLGRLGLERQSKMALSCRAAAREPWLLLTSLPDAATAIVDIYRMRMQIEETFRDLKSHRWGWSVTDIRSKDPRRVDVMLLLGAFAAVAMHLIGLSVRGSRLARSFQANTERRRDVFSTFFLGKLVIADHREHTVPLANLRAAMSNLISLLSSAPRLAPTP